MRYVKEGDIPREATCWYFAFAELECVRWVGGDWVGR